MQRQDSVGAITSVSTLLLKPQDVYPVLPNPETFQKYRLLEARVKRRTPSRIHLYFHAHHHPLNHLSHVKCRPRRGRRDNL